jgi:predicted flap endonuclease-1-like 5' DNA nuclease
VRIAADSCASVEECKDMATQSDLEAAFEPIELDDAYELQEHEFTLDPESDAPAPLRVRKRATPPPPPRRATDTYAAPPAQRGRSASGVFELVSAPAPAPAREVLTTLKGEVARLQAQMRARDAYLKELERALDERTRQLAAAGLGSLEDVARLFGKIRGQAFRVAELELEVRRLQGLVAQQQRRAARVATSGDDLRRIRGIGPRFAQQLESLGFTSFAAIASWSEADIARVAKRLRITAERVSREGWVEQARGLQSPVSA